MNLTLKRVESLLARGDVGKHLDRNGLYLIVSGKGAGHWSHRYQHHHRQHWMGLGPVAAFNLLEARELNRKALQERATGIDPLTAKRARQQAAATEANAAAQVVTFRAMATKYITDNQAVWGSAQHGRQWRRSLELYAFPLIGDRDVSSIDVKDVLAVLEQHVDIERAHPAGKFWEVRNVTADRVRSRLELVLNAAMARGLRPSGVNPASIDVIRHVLPKRDRLAPVAHHAALPYAEVPEFLVALRARQGIAPRALEFLILAAGRAGEVIGAVWSEIDLDAATWTIPASRMKAKREHRVPLSAPALALLRALPREDGNPHVFIGLRRPMLSPGAMVAVLERMGRADTTTVHGFRSSFRTWAAERTNFPPEVAELALAHSVDPAVVKAYKRTDLFDRRARLMEQWSAYCVAPAAQSKGGKVVGIGGAR
jgi:integrase